MSVIKIRARRTLQPAPDLSFKATGTVYSGDQAFQEMLDGTTDGAGTNYAVSWSGLGIIGFDENFENDTVLSDPIGITFDSSNNSLWLASDNDGTLHNYTLGDLFLSSFDPGLAGRACCLATRACARSAKHKSASSTQWL